MKFHGNAAPEAIVRLPAVRFTVLTPRLLRMEYDPQERFEDRPSQVFCLRRQPTPDFTTRRTRKGIWLETASLVLEYTQGMPFSAESLSIRIKGGAFWKFGDPPGPNLGGTTRTLDAAYGPVALEPGLLSRSGWTLLDDSASLVFDEPGWLTARQTAPGALDLYFFAYNKDYSAALADFYRVAGAPTVTPRWALGNWWSRYWHYSQAELLALMKDFQEKQVPLSVCIIDMDWHITRTGNQCSGWTGYTWNRELFSDPPGFLHSLHEMGLHAGLNLHPAEGIHPHEEAYPAMAQAMGIDPASGTPVQFDAEDPRFIEAYFKILHHPHETGGAAGSGGVDFWWMDWQQGNPARLPGLNLLWWINHLHFYDQGRAPERRHFLFSRWGGLGNHRYPIGFSGDTVVAWQSLAFQPYFTATAANVGYGWWSHDIGGHMHGIEDGELFTRWVQFGVFSPILRLHSTKNAFQERRPWGYDETTFAHTRRAFQLRHALIPYIYSMAWRDHLDAAPLCRPLYHEWPGPEDAYACPQEYLFGSQLLVAPFVSERLPDVQLSRQVAWLPPLAEDAPWFDFWNGYAFTAGWHAIYGGLGDIPVFARSGGIIPLDAAPQFGFPNLPTTLQVHIFPGANGQFTLYEDDGKSQAYLDGDYAQTLFSQTWQSEQQTLTIGPAAGQADLLPAQREYRLIFHAISQPASVTLAYNDIPALFKMSYDPVARLLTLDGIKADPFQQVSVALSGVKIAGGDWQQAQFDSLLKEMRANSELKRGLCEDKAIIFDNFENLRRFMVTLAPAQARALLETICDAGLERQECSGETLVTLWNSGKLPLRYAINVDHIYHWDLHRRFHLEQGTLNQDTLPSSRIMRPAQDFYWALHNLKLAAEVALDYGSVMQVKERFHTL